MTVTDNPRTETGRAQAAATHDRHARDVYAARLNAAGHYVMTLRCLSGRQRRELLSLLYGHNEPD